MSPQAAAIYKQITGVEPPKPFDEKTLEEHQRDKERFIALVNSGSDADDSAVDELFESIRLDRTRAAAYVEEEQEESA
jgi:hypothetical protein